MSFLDAAISPFQGQPSLRRIWLHFVKLCLGAGLRYNVFPKSRRNFLGGVHFLLRTGVLRQQTFDFTKAMVIEVASICNAACTFCPYPILEFPRKLMSDANFDNALAEAQRMQIQDIDFTPYLGEALVDPQFIPRIRKARQVLPSAYIRFITNGTLLTRFDMDELLTSGVSRISISFGAWGKEDYQTLYQIDAWDKVLAGVKKLLDAKERLRSRVSVGLWYRVLDSNKVIANPENIAFLKQYRHLLDEVTYTDVYHDILSMSGKQSSAIKVERQFDSSSLKKYPCVNLGKVACNSTGQWFACYCGATDCYKQEKSWFYLGSSQGPKWDIDEALREKVRKWEAGDISPSCRTCPVYAPANKPKTSVTHPAQPAPIASPPVEEMRTASLVQ